MNDDYCFCKRNKTLYEISLLLSRERGLWKDILIYSATVKIDLNDLIDDSKIEFNYHNENFQES